MKQLRIPLTVHDVIVDRGGVSRWDNFLISRLLEHAMDPHRWFDVVVDGNVIIVSQEDTLAHEHDTVPENSGRA